MVPHILSHYSFSETVEYKDEKKSFSAKKSVKTEAKVSICSLLNLIWVQKKLLGC